MALGGAANCDDASDVHDHVLWLLVAVKKRGLSVEDENENSADEAAHGAAENEVVKKNAAASFVANLLIADSSAQAVVAAENTEHGHEGASEHHVFALGEELRRKKKAGKSQHDDDGRLSINIPRWRTVLLRFVASAVGHVMMAPGSDQQTETADNENAKCGEIHSGSLSDNRCVRGVEGII